MNAHIPARDGREIAAEREQQVMHWLHRFGWLSTRQLARLVWPGYAQGQRMAQRTTERLVRTGAILRRTLPTGGSAYVLAEKGARRLRQCGDYGDAPNPRVYRDLRFAAPLHRALANDFAIDRILATKVRVYTEIEIQHRIAPRLHLPFRGRVRIPDVLIDYDGTHEWVEVERADKSRGRLDTLVTFAHHLLAPPANEATRTDLLVKNGECVGFVGRFRFLCWSDKNVRTCERAFLRYGLDTLLDDCPYQLAIQRADMTAGMVWKGTRHEITVEALSARLTDNSTVDRSD